MRLIPNPSEDTLCLLKVEDRSGQENGGSRAPLPTVTLSNVRFHAVSEAKAVWYVLDELDEGRGGWVVTHNIDHLRRLARDQSFARMCQRASLAVADGAPVVWASRLQGTPLPERVTGSNLISSLSAGAAVRGRSIYLLGGEPGTAEAAKSVLQARHPTLHVAGTRCPPMGFEHDSKQLADITVHVTRVRPDIVFVGLGSPKQERLIEQLRAELPNAWWLGVGVSFSFLCSRVKRAPMWVQRVGLEWAHRLAQEPRRLSRRYLREGIPFAAYVLASAAWQGLRTGRGRPSVRH